MQIEHVRMMSYGEATRLDTLLPNGAQRHAPVGGDVVSALHELNDAVRAAGFSPSQCKAPAMLVLCGEPPAKLADALRGAMGA